MHVIILGTFLNNIREIINSLGYWGVSVGMLIESACIPLPSELVLPLGGFMVSGGSASLLGVNIAAAVGSMTGSAIAYIVGYYGGRPFIINYGKYLFISREKFFKAEKAFNRFGNIAVFFGRLLPIIRTFISLPAGIARMNPFKFALYSLAGMLPWNFLLIYLGMKLGENFDKIVEPIYREIEYAVAGVIVLVILLLAVKGFFKKYRKSKI